MKLDTEFDLMVFQSEVFDDFTKIAATVSVALFHSNGYGSPEKFKEITKQPGLETGFLMTILLRFFSFLGKRAKGNILEKPDFIEKERKARKIADNPKIKKILCRALKREISPDLFREARQVKLVKIITTLLLKDELIKELAIEKDVRLFSLIVIKIYRQGVENYCR
jgi:hypothetical protein